MDTQTLINVMIGLSAFFGAWVLNSFRSSIRDLQTIDNTLADKVQQIEILVAGSYVRRDDLKELSKALFDRLDRIEEKLDKKADK